MEREPTRWEREVLEALVSVDGEGPYAPDAATLRESLPHLVVTGWCGRGCPSFSVRDGRMSTLGLEVGSYLCSDAVTSDGRIGMLLLVKDERPWSIDVMLARLLPLKTKTEYEPDAIPRAEASRAVKRATRYVAVAIRVASVTDR